MQKKICLLLLALTLPVCAQNSIETLCNKLENETLFLLRHWKYNNTAIPNGQAVDVAEDTWQTITFQERLAADSAWMRTTFTVPASVYGQPVGGRISITLNVDDAGVFYVDGRSLGRFDWDGSFTLTESAKPGQVFHLAIKAINTGGPMRLIHARLNYDAVAVQTQEIEDLILSLRVGDKLLSEDTYLQIGRTRLDKGIDHSSTSAQKRASLRQQLEKAALLVDHEALARGRFGVFAQSLVKARQALKPVSAFAKEFTLVLDANAHIDCAWLWRYLETIQITRNTFTSVLNMMEARPDFTYTQSQAHLYWWMEDLYPEVFDRIKTRIADKRWEVTGGMWVEPDCNLISGESWARQLLYGKHYFQEKFGVDVKIGWNPDSFGYNWNMPQFYRDAGIDAFITQKIGWNDTNMFPYRLFWWQGPDGSKLLTYFPYNYTDNLQDGFRLADWLRQFEANTGFKKMLILYGVGDHGGGPTHDMLDRAERFKRLDVFPTIVYGTAHEYLQWIRSHDLTKLPVWNDELYLEYHRGTATTQSNTKKANREGEILLGMAEQTASFAALYGGSYPHQDFQESWRGVLFNQFHDILPGSSIHPVYRDAAELYHRSEEIARHNLDAALDLLSRKVTAPSQGKSFLIYNPLAWSRSDVAEVELPIADQHRWQVTDHHGAVVPSQWVEHGRYNGKLVFIAKDIPAMGYAVFSLQSRTSTAAVSVHPRASKTSLETDHYLLELDEQTGFIKRLLDKKNQRPVLAGPGNELQLFKDVPAQWDAWEIAISDRYPLTYRGSRIVETGPVRTVLRTEHDFLKPGVVKEYPTPNNPNSYFIQDIILYEDLERIDFVTHADWWEDHVALKVAFAVAAQDSQATFEIPFGTIRRPTNRESSWQKARHEVNMQKWCDLSDADGDYGISLLNRSKYGGDIEKNMMRLSLLRSPLWPDPLADRGKHRIEYALYPHTGGWEQAGTMRKGYDYNYPLISRWITRSDATLPARHSFIQVDARNVILHTIKTAEASDSDNIWILRLFESEGMTTPATITLPAAIKKAVLSDFMEKDGKAMEVDGASLHVTVPAHRIMTIKVWF